MGVLVPNSLPYARSSRRNQDDRGTRSDVVEVDGIERYRLALVGNVLRRWQSGVDETAPAPLAFVGWKVKLMPSVHLKRQRAAATCPVWVTDVRTVPADTVHELFAGQGEMTSSQRNHHPRESKQINVLVGPIPVDPRELIILAIGIVIASLRAAEFVTLIQKQDSLGNEQDGQKIANLSLPKRIDLRIVRRAFHSAIP